MRGDDFAKPPLQRRWQAAGLTVESRANNVRPYGFSFRKRVNNSSALPGISSMRGDNFAKPPLQRRWQAAGLTEESRANNVRPYGKVLSSKPIFKIVPLEKAPEGCAYITRSIHHLLSHLPTNRQKKSLCVYRGIFYCNTIFLKRQHKTDPVFVFRFHLYPYFMSVGDALGDGQSQTIAAGRSGT